jgi:hypothetical protein
MPDGTRLRTLVCNANGQWHVDGLKCERMYALVLIHHELGNEDAISEILYAEAHLCHVMPVENLWQHVASVIRYRWPI